MKPLLPVPDTKCNAFARADALIILVTVLLGATVLFQYLPLSRAKTRSPRIGCVSDLKQIGLAFRIWSNDHDDKYPYSFANAVEPYTGTSLFQNATNAKSWMHFQVLSNEIQNAKILACPSDKLRWNNAADDFQNGPLSLSATNKRDLATSYFVGLEADETKPQAILAGDRNLTFSRWSSPYSSTNGAVRIPQRSWWPQSGADMIHSDQGNVVLADGSVQQVTSTRLQAALQTSEKTYGTNANTFLFPQ